ncbi:MAG TPA: tetratricopeptide repeat protein [Thermoanaerobaculia bacterium]
MRSRLLTILIVLSVAHSLVALDPPREREKWHRVRVGTFEIYSNGEESATKRVAENLQMLRGAIGKLTSLNVRSPMTTKVYLFKTDASFAPYRNATIGNSPRITGVFLAHRDGNYVLINGDSGEDPERAVAHELTHYYINNTAPDVPLWFHEGLGEFYSTFEASGREVKVGVPIPQHIQWLRAHPMIPLADLFAITTGSPEYNEGTRGGVYYAQSWAFMHYMLIGSEERRLPLREFMKLLGEGKPTEEAFRAAFKADYKTVEEELRQYVRRFVFPSITVKFAEDELIEPPHAEALSRDEVLFQLGDLLAHSQPQNYSDAQSFLQEALRLNASHASAHSILGFLSERTGDAKQASEQYERSMQLGATEAMPALLYGEHLLRELNTASRSAGDIPESSIAKTREMFRKAIQINPELPRAWSGLGATYVMSEGDPSEGIKALEKSWSLAPSQSDVAFNLAALYAKNGDSPKANQIIDRLLTRLADAETVRRARETVLVTEVQKADALTREGKVEDAIAILDKVIAATTTERLRKELTEHVAQLRATVARNQLIDQYNLAVRKAKADDIDGAIAILDALIPTGGDEEIVGKAKAMRERLKPLTSKKR